MTTPLSTKKIDSKKRSLKSEIFLNQEGVRLCKRVQNFAHLHQLWQREDALLICLSGGPDSVFLFHILNALARKTGFTLYAAHVNYGLREKESDEDEYFVASLCKQFHVPLSILRPKLGKDRSENALRVIRYRFFERLRKKFKYTSVVVGHQKNDQAETVLLHLFRGCGTEGMSGMQPKQGYIIRPLLTIRREEIISFLKENRLPFRVDSGNLTEDFSRNIIRNAILPLIAKKLQPNIIEVLARNALLFGEDAEALNVLPLPPALIQKNTVSFKQEHFLALPKPLQKRFLHRIIAETLGKKTDISSGNVTELQKALYSKKNKHQTILIPGLKCLRKGDTVTLRKIAFHKEK